MQPAIDATSLPVDALARREVLELRTVPDENCPVVPPEFTARLAEIDERTAQCHVRNEERTYAWHKLAERIRKGVK